MDNKELYRFKIFEEKEVTREESKIDEKTGEETVIKKKVLEKVPIEIVLKKPTRRQIEDADLEFSVEMSRCIKKGILTKAMLAKKYSDIGGAMSETESQTLVDLYQKSFELQNENARLDLISEKSDEILERISKIKTEIEDSRAQIIDIESSYRALFEHTADTKAQNKVLLWYIINLTNIKREIDLDPKPYFKGKDFEEKLTDFYEKEEKGEDFHVRLVKKLSTFVAFWFFNQASTKEEFEDLERRIEAGEL
jgi:hypothetical protein